MADGHGVLRRAMHHCCLYVKSTGILQWDLWDINRGAYHTASSMLRAADHGHTHPGCSLSGKGLLSLTPRSCPDQHAGLYCTAACEADESLIILHCRILCCSAAACAAIWTRRVLGPTTSFGRLWQLYNSKRQS